MPTPAPGHLRFVRWITSALATVLLATSAAGQSTRGAEGPSCYGFAFGTWSPALDWKAAGHAPHAPQGAEERTAEHRQWAVTGVQGDSVMVLFPEWWPVGVTVALARLPRASGDTAGARAVALVADGRLHAPTAGTRVWLVDCARPR